MVERTRDLFRDARSAGGNHPFVVIGLGMVLIAALTLGVLVVISRRRGISAAELADFRRWRRRRVVDPDETENGVDVVPPEVAEAK